MYRPDANKKSLFTAGRFDYAFGNNRALQYYKTFDGLKYRYQTDTGSFTAGYGKFKEGHRLLDSKAAFAEVEKFFKNGSALACITHGLTVRRMREAAMYGAAIPTSSWVKSGRLIMRSIRLTEKMKVH